MTREDIIRMAREAAQGMEGFTPKVKDPSGAVLEFYERFAALVAKHTLANIDPSSFMTWQEGYEAGKQTERERILDMCKEGLWDAEGIRYHLDNQDRGQA